MTDVRQARHSLIVGEANTGFAVVLSAVGTIDMLTAPQLQTHVDSVLSRQPAALIIDLSRVEFLGSAGINVLVNAHNEAGAVAFAVAADGPATSRPLRLLGIDKLLPIFASLTDAIDGLSARVDDVGDMGIGAAG